MSKLTMLFENVINYYNFLFATMYINTGISVTLFLYGEFLNIVLR